MAQQTMEIKMARFENSPWGFRLHGGADFSTPLTIQKVNMRSLSEAAGLQAGDMVLAVNGQDLGSLRHKEAQEAIVKSGNNFSLTILRGGGGGPRPQQQAPMAGAWKPDVKPVGSMPAQPAQTGQTFTKTSLAANNLEEDSHWDVKHNQSARGFGGNPSMPQTNLNGTSSVSSGGLSAPAAPTNLPSQIQVQYNSPQALYSEENIRDVLDQQSETLAGGVRGIDFFKPNVSSGGGEFDPATSITLKMVLDQDEADAANPTNRQFTKSPVPTLSASYYHAHQTDPSQASSEEKGLINKNVQSTSFKLLQRALEHEEIMEGMSDDHDNSRVIPKINVASSQVKAPRIKDSADDDHDSKESTVLNVRSVAAPITKPLAEGQVQPTGPPINTCSQCERLVTGVFVKVGGKALHAECFVCSTCKSSLKNVGYFNVSNKLYCETHARAAKAAEHLGQQTASSIRAAAASPSGASLGNTSASPIQPTIPQMNSQKSDWKTTLDADKAGAADNAEAFTKQFMSQMFGAGAGQPSAAAPNEQPPPIPPVSQPAPIIQSQPSERPVQPSVPAMQTRQMACGSMMGQMQPSAPAPVNPSLYSASNNNHQMQQSSQNLTVANSEDIVTTSQKPKKVGGSFQWPPSKEEVDQGPTATPMYIDPQQAQNFTQSHVGSLSSDPVGASVRDLLGLEAQKAPTHGPLAHSAPSPTPNQNGSAVPNYSPPQNGSQSFARTPQAQPPATSNWNETLNSNQAGSATNAEDFTKQFMADMFGGGMNQPGLNTQTAQKSDAPPPIPSMLQQNRDQKLAQQTQQQYMNQQQQQQQSSSMKTTIQSSSSSQHSASSSSSAMKSGMPALNAPPGSGILKNSFAQPPADPEPEAPASAPGQNLIVPMRGKGILQQQLPGMRTPQCGACDSQIRGPFITALGRTWCPGHFVCAQTSCGRSLQEVGFVEEQGHLYCEDCYGKFLAPDCEKCRKKILGNCLKAMQKTFHPECFVCAYCGKIFANSPFYLEDGLPYCEEDWNELFTTKCVSCGFPIEAGDRWVEALNNNYHSQCFNCTLCKKNLEGQGFFVKAGKPFCKSHAKQRF